MLGEHSKSGISKDVPPDQLPRLVWGFSLLINRQLTVAKYIEGLLPGDPNLLRLRKWIEEGTEQFGEDKAHSWKSSDIVEARKLIAKACSKWPGKVGKAVGDRLRCLIQEVSAGQPTKNFCPFCGVSLSDQQFENSKIFMCACCAIYIPLESTTVSPDQLLILNRNEEWTLVKAEFVGAWLVCRHIDSKNLKKPPENKCPFCKAIVPIQNSTVQKCLCGAISIPDISAIKLSAEMIHLSEVAKLPNAKIRVKISKGFVPVNTKDPEPLSSSDLTDRIKWLIGGEIGFFQTRHFHGEKSEQQEVKTQSEWVEVSPDDKRGADLFEELSKVLVRIAARAYPLERLDNVAASLSPGKLKVKVIFTPGPKESDADKYTNGQNDPDVESQQSIIFKYLWRTRSEKKTDEC